MYTKHLIVGGQSSTALTIFSLMRVRNRSQVPTKRTPTESAQHEEAWINWKRCTEISPREIRTDLHEFTGLEYNNWIFINFSLQVDPGHCFHPTSPEGFIDERREQLKVLKRVSFRTRIAHISFTPSWSSVLRGFHSSSAHTKIGPRLPCPTFKKPFTIGKTGN